MIKVFMQRGEFY